MEQKKTTQQFHRRIDPNVMDCWNSAKKKSCIRFIEFYRLFWIRDMFFVIGSRKSLWQKDSLITHILFELCLFRNLAQCTFFSSPSIIYLIETKQTSQQTNKLIHIYHQHYIRFFKKCKKSPFNFIWFILQYCIEDQRWRL